MGWALLQMSPLHWEDYGAGADAFEDLCCQESLWVCLEDLSTFQIFLKDWGNGRQQDIHELLQHFLLWMMPRCINLTWNSSVDCQGIVQIKGQGTKWTPPTLSVFEESVQHTHTYRHLWITGTPIVECVRPLKFLCVHLDRYESNYLGVLSKLNARLGSGHSRTHNDPS